MNELKTKSMPEIGCLWTYFGVLWTYVGVPLECFGCLWKTLDDLGVPYKWQVDPYVLPFAYQSTSLARFSLAS
jgi:hypothetical protein